MSEIKRTIEDKHVYWEMDWHRAKENWKDDPDNAVHKKPDVEMMFEEEPALALLLINHQVFMNTHWWMKDEGWPKDATETFSFNVNCNDVFAWGCADAEEMFDDDLRDVYDHFIKDPMWGTAVWCMKKRNQLPQKPVYDKIMAAGIWDLDNMGLDPNDKYK